MATIVLSAFLIASAIPERSEVSLTAGPAITMDDVVDAATGRVPEFCIGFVRQAGASLSGSASEYELANARNYALQQCVGRIRGETPN